MIEVLYKDSDIVICIKAVGLLSAADSSGRANMMSELAKELDLSEIYPIHRLDKEVSGVMVYALSKFAAAKLSKDAADHTRFVKEYLAVVSGCPETPEGIYEDLLFKDSSKNKVFVVKKERKGVKKAKLSYKVLESEDDKTLLKIRLFTGRTHQIRVQLSSRKMPIIGDRKYGGKAAEGIALYSHSITIYHPKTNERMTFTSEPDNIILR